MNAIKIKRVLFLFLCVGILAGCTSEVGAVEKSKQSNITKYKYDDDSQFKVVHDESIKNFDEGRVTITILAHTKTKVMYLQTEKFSQGYGVGLEVMLDEHGNPLLYDGEF